MSAPIRDRGGLRAVPGRLSLAGRMHLSSVPASARISGGASAMVVRRLSASGVAHGGHGPAQYEDAADDLVLGGLPDGYRQARRVGLVGAAAVGPAALRRTTASSDGRW